MQNSILGSDLQKKNAAREAYVTRKELTNAENQQVEEHLEMFPQKRAGNGQVINLVLQKVKSSIMSLLKKDTPGY